jgi:hypothetical protein
MWVQLWLRVMHDDLMGRWDDSMELWGEFGMVLVFVMYPT